jgi:hypothetical protein
MVRILKNPKHREYPETVNWLENHARNYWPYDPDTFEPRAVRFSDPKKRWKAAFSGAASK